MAKPIRHDDFFLSEPFSSTSSPDCPQFFTCNNNEHECGQFVFSLQRREPDEKMLLVIIEERLLLPAASSFGFFSSSRV